VEYDVNIQNIRAASEDLGFWDRNGVYKVPEARTAAIFNERRFVCDRRGLSLGATMTSCKSQFELKSCAVVPNAGEPCFARTVRVNPNQKRNPLEVDFRDYGRFDGTIEERRLTKSLSFKPFYESAPWASKLCP
jgi:hypothetical protein